MLCLPTHTGLGSVVSLTKEGKERSGLILERNGSIFGSNGFGSLRANCARLSPLSGCLLALRVAARAAESKRKRAGLRLPLQWAQGTLGLRGMWAWFHPTTNRSKNYPTRAAAIEWIAANQLGRRD